MIALVLAAALAAGLPAHGHHHEPLGRHVHATDDALLHSYDRMRPKPAKPRAQNDCLLDSHGGVILCGPADEPK